MTPAPPRCSQPRVVAMPGVLASKESLVNAAEFSSISPPSSSYSGENNLNIDSTADAVLSTALPAYSKTPTMSDGPINEATSSVSTDNQNSTASGDTQETPATVAAVRSRHKGKSARELFEKLLLRAEDRQKRENLDVADARAKVRRQEDIREAHLKAFERAVVHEGMLVKYQFEVPTMDAEEIRENAARRKKKHAPVVKEEVPMLAVPVIEPLVPEPRQIEEEEEENDNDDIEEVEVEVVDISSFEKNPEREARTNFDRKRKHRNAAAEALANIMAGARRECLDDDGIQPRMSKKRTGLRSQKREIDADENSEPGPDSSVNSPIAASPMRVRKKKNGDLPSSRRRTPRNRTDTPSNRNSNRKSRRRSRKEAGDAATPPPRTRRRIDISQEDGEVDDNEGSIHPLPEPALEVSAAAGARDEGPHFVRDEKGADTVPKMERLSDDVEFNQNKEG